MKILKTMFRHYVSSEQLDAAVAFYEQLQRQECERRLSFAEVGIEVAVVGSFILLAGSDSALAPVRHIQAAFVVDSVDAFSEWLRTQGADVPTGVHESAVGRNITVRHADGFIAEYFEASAS
jgi:hypothetical protein